MRRSRKGEESRTTNLMKAMKMKKELCLPRLLKVDVASVGSLDTRRWTVDPAVGSRSTITTRRVGRITVVEVTMFSLQKQNKKLF